MTIRNPESSPSEQPLYNKDGEEVRSVTFKDGRTAFVTREEFDQINPDELQIPHSGTHGEKPVREFSETSLQDAHDTGKINPLPPAGRKSPAHDRLAPRYTRRQKVLAGAGILLAGSALTLGGFKAFGGDSPDSAKNLDPTSVDKNALNVDGNLYPEKANGEYDKMYGIYEVDKNGNVDKQALIEKLGLVDDYRTDSPAEGWRLTRDNAYIEANDDFEILSERNKVLNEVYVPNLEALINTVNMNNPEAQMARASKLDDVDQSLLLQNMDLKAQLNAVFSGNDVNTGNSVSIGRDVIDTVTSKSPNDASLRATVCPFAENSTPRPEVCIEAQKISEATGNNDFVEYSIFSESTFEDGSTQLVIPDGTTAESYWTSMLTSDTKVGVVWTNAQGEIVNQERYVLPTVLTAVGNPIPGDTEPEKNTNRIFVG